MAPVLKGSYSFTCTLRVHPLTEWTIPAFAFPAEAGTHLPTSEGWKAELALGGWLVTYWNRCPAPGIEPDTVTHLSTNRVRSRLTSLIKANVLTTTPDRDDCQFPLPSIYSRVIFSIAPRCRSLLRTFSVNTFGAKISRWKVKCLLSATNSNSSA